MYVPIRVGGHSGTLKKLGTLEAGEPAQVKYAIGTLTVKRAVIWKTWNIHM